MNAANLAKLLINHGVPVLASMEGDDVQDGMVSITDKVHVQVPTYGSYPNVVFEREEVFTFYPERNYKACLDNLLSDIRDAMRRF